VSKIGMLTKSAHRILKNNTPTILTGLGVSGLLATVVLAVRATPEATRRIDKLVEDMNDDHRHGGPAPLIITKRDIIKINWQLYIPAAVVGGTTIACIIGANSVSGRRNAALISLYTLTERAYGEYREKVVHTLGENKEARVRDEIAQDRVIAAGPSTTIIGTGNIPCFDTFTGRYFESTVEKIRKAENDINRQCINEMYASQNEFYRLIGLPAVAVGEEVGWTTDNVLEIQFSAVLDDGKPVMALEYRKQPKIGFTRVWG
jgi:hypothetical protein